VVGPPGSAVITASRPANSRTPFVQVVASVRLNGPAGAVDVTDQSPTFTAGATYRAEIVVTNRAARLAGTLTDAGDRPAPYALVLLFPNDRSHWVSPRLVRTGFSDRDGRYEVTDLAPGNYRAVGVGSLPRDSWYDPAVLERLWPVATPIQLRENEERMLPLKIRTAYRGQ
jgi:hypothetical protein